MYTLKRIWLQKDPEVFLQWQKLITRAGLAVGEEVAYTVGIFDQQTLIATASCYANIIKYVVVCEKRRSEQLLTQLISHLSDHIKDEGFTKSFVYTAPKNRLFFESLGFREVLAAQDILFMEQGVPSFESYAQQLQRQRIGQNNGAIVMNANPFTKGHLYLVETAASQKEQVYVFVLSEDRSQFSTSERLQMVTDGVAHLPNVTVLPTNNYLVSSAVFPSYFLKEQVPEAIAKKQAAFDATLFKEKIAPLLAITTRFVGSEPYSPVTQLYNEAMAAVFSPELELIVIDRLKINQSTVSATNVRKAIAEKDLLSLQQFLPETTFSFLMQHNYI